MDLRLAGSDDAQPVSMSKDLEYWDGVGVRFQGGVEPHVSAEGFPQGECVGSGVGSGATDSQGDSFRNSAEVKLEVVSFGGGTSVQEGVIGNRVFSSRKSSCSVK
jgi:hypothetical protein